MGFKTHLTKFKRGVDKVGQSIGKGAKDASNKFKEWEAQAPERQKKRIEALKRQEEEMSVKAKIAKHKRTIEVNRPKMTQGSFFNPLGAPPPQMRSSGSKKKKGKKKTRSYYQEPQDPFGIFR